MRDRGAGTARGIGTRWAGALAVAACTAWGQAAEADARVALVIGNGAYTHAPVLANPLNDATDIGAALGRLGFAVTSLEDTGYGALRRGLLEFQRAASASEIAVVFYAGHGIEVDGRNFLVPVDARLASDRDVEYECLCLVFAVPTGARQGAGRRHRRRGPQAGPPFGVPGVPPARMTVDEGDRAEGGAGPPRPAALARSVSRQASSLEGRAIQKSRSLAVNLQYRTLPGRFAGPRAESGHLNEPPSATFEQACLEGAANQFRRDSRYPVGPSRIAEGAPACRGT